MICPKGCRELVESPKQWVEFPIQYETICPNTVYKNTYKIGYMLSVKTCPICDYAELVKHDDVD